MPDPDLPVEGPDEELDARPDASARTRRLRRDLLVGAVGLIAALGVVRLVAHHPTTPSGTASTQPTSTPTVRSADVAAPGLPTRGPWDASHCTPAQCITVASAPAAVTAAIRDSFPGARPGVTETVRLVRLGAAGPLWYREVEADAPGKQIMLRIEAHAAGDRISAGSRDNGGVNVTYYESPRLQWLVRVEVQTRSGVQQPLRPLVRLAADPRVLLAG